MPLNSVMVLVQSTIQLLKIKKKKLSSSHFKGIREFLYSSKISSNYVSFHLQPQNTVLS
ncbi:hypothetical protein GV236_02890 [Streptococcus pneumoniae]|nr:hypothetical protein [Streptococcus pneumoniae]